MMDTQIAPQYGMNRTSEESMPLLQQDASPDLIKWQITGEDIADSIELSLGGKTWNYNSAKYEQRTKSLLCDEGIATMKMLIYTNIGKGPILCNFTDEREIREIVGKIWETAVDTLFMNWRVWGIEKHNLSIIGYTVRNQIYYALKKGKDGFYMGNLKPAIKRTENITMPQGGKGGGFLSFLNPIK